jgi:hypothetical protein
MITSLPSGSSTITFDSVTVRLDGKVIGKIEVGADKMFRYYPKGSKNPGEPFATLEACQRSLQ